VPQTRFSRAFVIGAYNPNGGTYMAYHVGRILQLDFSIEAVAVNTKNETADNGVLRYDLRMPTISVEDLSRTITDSDLLIVNPSFSNYSFGWKLPGFKISYVQNFATYTLLDCRYDHYVAVSEFVKSFLQSVYAIDAPVIPAFINVDQIPPASDWKSRPQFKVLPYRKGLVNLWDLSFDRLREILNERGCKLTFEEPLFSGRYMPQSELFEKIGRYRYLLMLSPAEGFPLVPLEAMGMGTVMIGYDGFGGRHYMQPGINCAVAPYAQIERVAEHLISLSVSPERGLAMSLRGRETAKRYTYDAFRQRWIEELSRIVVS